MVGKMMVRDAIVLKDTDTQVTFNQYSFRELVKHLMVNRRYLISKLSKRVELILLTLAMNVMRGAVLAY